MNDKISLDQKISLALKESEKELKRRNGLYIEFLRLSAIALRAKLIALDAHLTAYWHLASAQEGYNAFSDGIPRENNPYDNISHSLDHELWDSAWLRAERESFDQYRHKSIEKTKQ